MVVNTSIDLGNVTESLSLLEQMRAINQLSNGFLGSTIIIFIGFVVIMVVYKNAEDMLTATQYGSLAMTLIGIPLSVLGLVSAYFVGGIVVLFLIVSIWNLIFKQPRW